MSQEYYSLREIGRRIGVPPSSVVYYKDRFSRFIPSHLGEGRRKKYPQEALTVFKEIREMFNSNWSAEQIEHELSARFGKRFGCGVGFSFDAPGRSGSNGSGLAAELTGVLDKVPGLLENQALFRAEIDSLRQEVVSLKEEKALLEMRYKEQIRLLEDEIRKLRDERAEMMRQILDKINRAESQGQPGASSRAKSESPAPTDHFLSLPLVIRTDQNEYLGVAGKTRHFCLREFIRIIEENGSARKTVALSWRGEGAGWVLRIITRDRGSSDRHEHVLDVSQTVTPSNNEVVQITRLSIDGRHVPDPFLLVLFRKIKDSFED